MQLADHVDTAVEVDVRVGTRHVRFRPLVTVVNATAVPLEAALAGGGGAPGSAGQTVEEEVFENQRYIPLRGWSSDALLPTDWMRWSTRGGGIDDDSLQDFCARARVGLPEGWVWVTEWTVDRRGNTDNEGWSYEQAMEFFEYPFPKGSGSASPLDFVRRRRWTRIRQRLTGLSIEMPPLMPGKSVPLPAEAAAAGLRLQIRPLKGASPEYVCDEYSWAEDAGVGGFGVPLSAPAGDAARAAAAAGAGKSMGGKPPLPHHGGGGGGGGPLHQHHRRWLVCAPAGSSASDWRAVPFWVGVRTDITSVPGKNGRVFRDVRLTISGVLVLENLLPVPAAFGLLERQSTFGAGREEGEGARGGPAGAASAADAGTHLVPRATVCLAPGERREVHGADPRAALFLELAPEGGWRRPSGKPPVVIRQMDRGRFWKDAAGGAGGSSQVGAGQDGAWSDLPQAVQLVDMSGNFLFIRLEHIPGQPHVLQARARGQRARARRTLRVFRCACFGDAKPPALWCAAPNSLPETQVLI